MIRWAYRSPIVLAVAFLAVAAWAPPGSAGRVHHGLVEAAGWLMAAGRELATEAFGEPS